MESKTVGYFDGWNIRYRSGTIEANSIAGQLGAAVLREIAALPVKNPRFVEIGCGTGWLAERLVGSGVYFGLDLSPAAIKVAQNRIPGARFVAADFLECDFKGENFNVGLLVDSISYFSDQDSAISKIFDLLDDKSHFVLTSVNPFVYSRMSWVGPPAEGQVRKWLSKASLIALLCRHGFEVVKFYTIMPDGDRGILRLVNSRKINGLLEALVPSAIIKKAKESVGFGQYFVVVARKI
jgi:SAM-dependent methyltransferase